ncbi:hypothetical protein Ddc_07849 [Ditylenchus destructor]|nr:hypothetical protein Ddc_07849 [Ditylenchus destructor]
MKVGHSRNRFEAITVELDVSLKDSGHQTYDIQLPEKHIPKPHRKENHEFEIIGAPPDYSSLSSGPKPPSLGQGVVAEAVIGIETEPSSALQSVAATAVW